MIIHFALLADTESVDFKEVAREQTWKQAMIEKLQSIEKNHIWEPTELPPKKKPIEVKWIFKLKLNSDGLVTRHKARLVAKGFMQKAEVDYKEIFAPMTIIETIRLAMALASKRNWLVYHYVKYAFLNGSLNEDVYVTQPPRFEIKGKKETSLQAE